MARVIRAKLPWHVIATGFTKDDFVIMSRGNAILQPGCTEDHVTWFETEALALEHPAARDGVKAQDDAKALHMIDGESGIVRGDMHTIKKHEAELVRFDSVTDPERLPYMIAEIAKRDDGSTLADVAEEWWLKHRENAEREATRIDNKREVRKS